MLDAVLGRPSLIVAAAALVFAGGFVAGGKVTTWFAVTPLEAEVDELNRRLIACGDNETRLQASLEHVRAQIRELAGGCATSVDEADQAARDALVTCDALPADATVEEWNAWLAACSPPAP